MSDAPTCATKKARCILATHVPAPLPEEVLREIRRIVDAADRAAEVHAFPGGGTH